MRTFTAGALAACLLPFALPAPAHAAVTASGSTCGMDTEHDRTNQDPDAQIGQIEGGPVTAHDPANPLANPVTIWVECDVQVQYATHASADAATAMNTGLTTTGVPSTLSTFSVQAGDPVYLCTAWYVQDALGNSASYYYDAATATFLLDPAVATCVPAGPSLLGTGVSVQEVSASV